MSELRWNNESNINWTALDEHNGLSSNCSLVKMKTGIIFLENLTASFSPQLSLVLRSRLKMKTDVSYINNNN